MEQKAVYSPLHKAWVVQNEERPELIVGSGKSKDEAIRNALANLESRGVVPREKPK